MASRVALVYVHGIGSQDRYEGMAQMSDCLQHAAKGAGWPEVEESHDPDHSDHQSHRAQRRFKRLDLQQPGAPNPLRIDIYEAYWAPHFNGGTTTLSVGRWLGLVMRKFAGLTLITAVNSIKTPRYWGLVMLFSLAMCLTAWLLLKLDSSVSPLKIWGEVAVSLSMLAFVVFLLWIGREYRPGAKTESKAVNLKNYRRVQPDKTWVEVLSVLFTVFFFAALFHHAASMTILTGSQLVHAREEEDKLDKMAAALILTQNHLSGPPTKAQVDAINARNKGVRYGGASNEDVKKYFFLQPPYLSFQQAVGVEDQRFGLKWAKDALEEIAPSSPDAVAPQDSTIGVGRRYFSWDSHSQRIRCYWRFWKAAWVVLFRKDSLRNDLPELSFDTLRQTLSVRDMVAGLPWLVCFFLAAKNLLDWLAFLPGLAWRRFFPPHIKAPDTPNGQMKRQYQLLLATVLSFGFAIGLSLFNSLAVQMFLGALAAVQLLRRWLDKVLLDILGDIEIYSTRHESEARFKARESALEEVQERLCEVMCHACNYEAVYLVGHSLGSCLALDTLRRLHADHLQKRDLQNGEGIPGWEKLRGFVTCGSPIVKMALFFDQRDLKSDFAEWNTRPDQDIFQPGDKDSERRVVGEQDEAVSKIRWKNFWFESDIICNQLSPFGFPVEDIPLKAPFIELWSHSSYWKDRLFGIELLDMVTEVVPTARETDSPMSLSWSRRVASWFRGIISTQSHANNAHHARRNGR